MSIKCPPSNDRDVNQVSIETSTEGIDRHSIVDAFSTLNPLIIISFFHLVAVNCSFPYKMPANQFLNELCTKWILIWTAHHSPAAAAVRGLLMLAILITVLLEHNTLFSTSAKPNPSLQTVFPSMLTATQTPGEPVSSFIHLMMDCDSSIADCRVKDEEKFLFVSSIF